MPLRWLVAGRLRYWVAGDGYERRPHTVKGTEIGRHPYPSPAGERLLRLEPGKQIQWVANAAVPDIGFPEMLAPDQSVGPEPDRQQCSVDFADSGSRCRPSADIGVMCPIAVIGRVEFSRPVTQNVSMERGSTVRQKLKLHWSVPLGCGPY